MKRRPSAQATRTKTAGASRPPSAAPLVGIGYRTAIAEWTRAHLACFDALEITVDHCLYASASQRRQIFDLVGRVPLTAHGIGLSIGTDCPLDLAYLDRVGAILDRLKAPAYSEHLAFTRVPGRDLANLLPLPRTEAVAEQISAKVREIRSRIGVPFLLENIASVFEWPDSTLSEVEFLNLICRETGAGLLLDIENLHLNARNHGFDGRAFLDALTPGLVQEIHMAGGLAVRDGACGAEFFADSHSHPVPDETLALLDHALERHRPKAIILERDDRLDAGDEILADMGRIRALLAKRDSKTTEQAEERPQSALLDRQVALLDYLTSARAIFGGERDAALPPLLRGIDPVRLGFEARFSHEKRMAKLARVFPHTLELLKEEQGEILRAFAEACPPTDIGILETAQQFFAFLSARARPLASAYLLDVARCELALAAARLRKDGPLNRGALKRAKENRGAGTRAVRRADAVALVRCTHDVRPLFESAYSHAVPKMRDTPLVIAKPQTAREPEIFEVPATLFDLLAALDDWTERRLFDLAPGAEHIIADLVERGVLEVRA